MATKKTYELTQDGVNKLKLELDDLKFVKREENLTALKEARAQGDLSENADYDAARNEQARIESRITEIEGILKNVKIIKNTDDDLVNIGKTVELKFLEKNKIQSYYLVGTIEADPKNLKISVDSPLGKAITKAKKGDIVTVRSETNRTYEVEILSIK
jgi:transcription elongation factor GreA